MTKPKLRVGLIGSGFMGKAHAFGYTTAARVFDLPYELELHTLADINDEAAAKAAAALGFARSTSDWRALVADPDIDVVNVTAPNALHKEMALAAIAAGKHVYCEKPLAPLAADAREMAEAAETAGVKTQVGFNYLCNPMLGLARDMIAAGELGEIRGYRGVHAEDYMADADGPFTFRHDPAGGGALADIGSHALATAEFLLGAGGRADHEGHGRLRHDDRRAPRRQGRQRDASRSTTSAARSCASRAARPARSKATGSRPGARCSTTSRSTGRKARSPSPRSASTSCTFSRPTTGAAGRVSAASRPAPTIRPTASSASRPGHQLGFNDLKAIEVAGFLDALAGRRLEPFNFRAGLRIQTLVETIQASSREGAWKEVP